MSWFSSLSRSTFFFLIFSIHCLCYIINTFPSFLLLIVLHPDDPVFSTFFLITLTERGFLSDSYLYEIMKQPNKLYGFMKQWATQWLWYGTNIAFMKNSILKVSCYKMEHFHNLLHSLPFYFWNRILNFGSPVVQWRGWTTLKKVEVISNDFILIKK